jgi:hypothetical protein
MDTEKLNESIIGTILAGAIVALAFWAIKEAGQSSVNLITRAMGSGMQVGSKNVKLFLDNLLKNKAFILDFSKIIQDEGGIDEFIKKTKYDDDVWDGADNVTPAVIWYGYQEFSKDKNYGLNLNKHAVKIVDKLVKLNSFKSLTQKYKLDDREIQYISNSLFLTITDPDFKKVGEKFMKTALEKNANKLENSISLKKLLPNNNK